MCGILGALNFSNGSRPFSAELLSEMSALLRHRGPDDAGVYVNENIGIAHRRLSVIDLTSAGHQPMVNEDGTQTLVQPDQEFILTPKPELRRKPKFRRGAQ